jgi:hypothetical protein
MQSKPRTKSAYEPSLFATPSAAAWPFHEGWTRYRDARTGRFVTKTYAKKNRETTVKELRRAA